MSQLPALVQREKPRPTEDSPPVVRIQKMIFQEATTLGASDIHIEPGPESTKVRYRVDGVLRDSIEVPRWMHDNLVVRIKVLARLDISERRLPQDGHITGDEGSGMDIRVSVIPTRCGEKIVIRTLRRGRSMIALSGLGLQPAVEESLHALIRRPQGILLCVGPTGSGKTTTLYACIGEIKEEPLNIVTIEDPIEYEMPRINQTQVNERTGLTFSRALRSILRQDPDVILVGEIRDSDTAETAFHAAMTGHLVLSTLHATDAISAFFRLAELGVDRAVLATSVVGIVAQRLVRLNCSTCSAPEYPRPIYLKRLYIQEDRQLDLRRSPGCPVCNFSGSSGRLGLFELLEINRSLRKKIISGVDDELRGAARDGGFVGITEQAVELALSGRVSLHEVYRNCFFGGE